MCTEINSFFFLFHNNQMPLEWTDDAATTVLCLNAEATLIKTQPSIYQSFTEECYSVRKMTMNQVKEYKNGRTFLQKVYKQPP